MSGSKYDGWTADREISFLDGVMECKNKFFNPKITIRQILQNYITTLDRRAWDANIDVPAIRLHAQSLLAKCR